MRNLLLFVIIFLSCSLAIAQPTRGSGSAPIGRASPLVQDINGDYVLSGDLITTGTDERIYGNTYPANIIDFNDNAIYVRVDPSMYTLGFLGVGTSAPRAKFEVDGTVYATGKLDVDDIIYARGNLGVGISAPTEKVAVDGSIYLKPQTAPFSTDDVIYNVGGNLYWKGTKLN